MIEDKIKIRVRNVWLGGLSQLRITDCTNGITLRLDKTSITLTYKDWMKVQSGIITMGKISPWKVDNPNQ